MFLLYLVEFYLMNGKSTAILKTHKKHKSTKLIDIYIEYLKTKSYYNQS